MEALSRRCPIPNGRAKNEVGEIATDITNASLCEVDPSEDLLEKCILVDRQIASFIIGNKPIIKLFQVLKPTEEFNLHVMV